MDPVDLDIKPRRSQSTTPQSVLEAQAKDSFQVTAPKRAAPKPIKRKRQNRKKQKRSEESSSSLTMEPSCKDSDYTSIESSSSSSREHSPDPDPLLQTRITSFFPSQNIAKVHNANPDLMLRVISWNACSLSKKVGDVIEMSELTGANIVGIQETRCTNLTIPGFSGIYNKRRKKKVGVALFFQHGILPIRRNEDLELETKLDKAGAEAVCASVQTSCGNYITLVSIYLNPALAAEKVKQSLLLLDGVPNLLVFGDWNSSGKYLRNKSGSSSSHGRIFDAFMESKQICLVPTTPYKGKQVFTRKDAWLDAALVSTCPSTTVPLSFTSSARVLAPSASDHDPLLIEVGINLLRSDLATPPPNANRYNYNWGMFKHMLRTEGIPQDPKQFSLRISRMLVLCQSSINHSGNAPWWNFECRKAKRKRNRAHKRFKQNKITRQAYDSILTEYHRVCASAKHQHKIFLASLAATDPWYAINSIVGSKYSRKQAPKDYTPQSSIAAQNVSNSMGQEFLEISSDPKVRHDGARDRVLSYLAKNWQVEWPDLAQWEIQEAILRPSNRSAPGPDGIPVIAMKQIWKSQEFRSHLTSMFNYALRSFPWKSAHIIPIPKGEGKGFRPISLLSQVGKILERAVAKRLNWSVDLPIRQYGCRPGTSVDSVLYAFQHAAVDSHRFIGALFYDVSKAYDKVNPYILLDKMIGTNIPLWVLWFTYDFLISRTFQVNYKGAMSAEAHPRWGLPQGSPLSPLLFKLFFDPPETENDFLFMDDYACIIKANSYEEFKSVKSRIT